MPRCARSKSDGRPPSYPVRSTGSRASGGRTEAGRILREILAAAADSGYAFEVAEIYTGLGDFDRAFLWLDRSFDDYSLLPGIMGPLFDELRADPRFNSVRRRLGIETMQRGDVVVHMAHDLSH